MRCRAGTGALVVALAAFAAPGFAYARAAAPPLPRTPQHTEYVVEVNAKGQVSRVRSGKSAPDRAYDTMTLGNALQAYIRTTDGKAIAGIYRLNYDYDPRSKRVRRTVRLVRSGGVDPKELGAVEQMAQLARRGARPRPSAAPNTLPDFGSITGVNR